MMRSRRDFLKATSLSVATAALPPMGTQHPVPHSFVPKKTPTIMLRSSWRDANIGDQGHTPGTLRLLERHIPEAQLLLWHAEPRPETEKLVTQNFPKVKIVRGNFYTGDQLSDELKAAFDQTDLLIHNSSQSFNYGLYNYEWGGPIRVLTPFYYCYDKGIPFGIYGQSFDKFAPPSQYFFRDILNRAAFLYARDNESLNFLKAETFHPSILEFAPDGCFGIDIRDERKGLAYLTQAGLEDGKFLVVIIRTNTPHFNEKGEGNLLNPTKPTPEQQEQDRTRMAKIREVITHWVKETGYKVLLAPEVDKEMPQAKNHLYDQLDATTRQKVVLRDTFWNADEAMSVYARAHSLIGMEPHSLIMGLALGKPVVHVRSHFHGRKGWMFRDIGLPEWLFEVDESPASAWIDQLSKIHRDYPAAKAKAQKAMAFVQKRQSESMMAVRKIVGLPSTK
ncbi:polysaccharide pyruvyl transferase family protein [Larkinella sp. C7]|jgi:polysaccharide pyruvyl transferase WcaK-like protein|uniref:polysaccharide pyruvyl transferase family protein n=1 Tax=Larkinella sp. C7 TaxID=2576607 RepID=UPI0011114CED|nr:polysaccharide pyruvyl transferase family protein [Larkinella sp. C7]